VSRADGRKELVYEEEPWYELGATVWVGGVPWTWCVACRETKKRNDALDVKSYGARNVCRACYIRGERPQKVDRNWDIEQMGIW